MGFLEMQTFMSYSGSSKSESSLELQFSILKAEEHQQRTKFLSSSTKDILGQVILCWGEMGYCLVHYSMLSNIPGPYFLDADSTFSQAVTTKTIYRHDKCSRRWAKSYSLPQLRNSGLENSWSNSLNITIFFFLFSQEEEKCGKLGH